MKGDPEQRAVQLGEYIAANRATVRAAAAVFGCSKSTVHKDVAVRLRTLQPELFRQVDPVTNMAGNSALASLGLSALWLVYFYGANVGGPWFGPFSFDSSELPIITLYGMYVPMFIQLMRKGTDLSPFRRFVMPALALCSCGFMVYAAFAGYGVTVLYYLGVYAVVMGIGWLFDRRKKIHKPAD